MVITALMVTRLWINGVDSRARFKTLIVFVVGEVSFSILCVTYSRRISCLL